jgi:hypothetical protein
VTTPLSLFSIHQTLNVVLANCTDQISDRRIPLEEHLTRFHKELRRMLDDVNRAKAVGKAGLVCCLTPILQEHCIPPTTVQLNSSHSQSTYDSEENQMVTELWYFKAKEMNSNNMCYPPMLWKQ